MQLTITENHWFMYIKKKNRLEFYSELKLTFPEIAKMKFWKEHDYVDDPSTCAGIMTAIGEVVIHWARESEIEKIGALMTFFEQSYQSFSDEAICYIYTDFLPTIISMQNSEHREIIKSQILPLTKKDYDQLLELGLYAEY